MSALRVSSNGHIVLHAALRRRLGMEAGTRLEVAVVADGLKLRVIRSALATGASLIAQQCATVRRGA